MVSHPIAVLLVEDNPADAIFIRELLDDNDTSPWRITHVSRLSLALERLNQAQFDVALLDLSLPDSAELNVVIQIHTALPELPLVVLTGLDDEALGVEAVRQGAQDYLVKGEISRNLLTKSIRYAIERAASQRTMRQQAAAMAAASDGIAILDRHYRYLYINQSYANLYGYGDVNQPLGQLWTLLQLAAEVQPSVQEIQSALQTGGWIGEVSGTASSGAAFELELSITGFDRGSFICLVRDIRDRKRARAEIQNALNKERELNQLKSSFIAMVSHEFRTPMTGIRVAASLLQDYGEKATNNQKAKFLERIQASVDEMLELLDELLLLDSSQAGGLRYEPIAFDLEQLCRELAETIQFNAGNSHRIVVDYRGGCSTAEMDAVLLRHILTNLLSNAIKYSPHGEDILFSLHCRDNIAVFQVEDRGIGIAQKDRERLFEPFYRCSNVGQISGTGLGLSIVQQCVELHQGKIEVESQLGKGTTFIVSLPLRPSR